MLDILIELNVTITCPQFGFAKIEQIPLDA
jgi:hypothetical protein